MYKTLRLLICASVLCLAQAVQAQSIANSPYSRYGLGELNTNLGNLRTAGMGGVGVSSGSSFHANTANPALLYYNSVTIFDIGVAGQYKTLKNSSLSQRDGDANLNYLTLGVPLSKRWSSALSLRPYSTVDYRISSIGSLPNRPEAVIINEYSGEGGISELYFGHGVRIADGLTIGASASYLFGTITQESSTIVGDTSVNDMSLERVAYAERTRYNDFLFRTGANYRKKVAEKAFLSAGAVYTLGTELSAKRNTSYERRDLADTPKSAGLLPDSLEGSVNMPGSLQAALSYDNGANLTVGAEFFTQDWSDYRNLDGDQELGNSYKVNLGAEYTPNANAIDSYFKRITYRAGVRYGQSPYVVNGEQIKDMAVTSGFTFPIGRGSYFEPPYQLNVMLGYGKRGTTDNGLITENYLQFGAGVTINSRWFVKRRIE
ncbi:hypothetical protein H9Q13_09875 [Pontibacter sp. JH31]|uniref:Long-chain fatty acid transport protein n=1 Tax=Pontibacter aquaedesilientis TaxID=2766980 RepID=A0ABR7XGP6_9BACT|nr:hypothetical protein [Pontibacter aquaedesilientis]MBD1397474.1 hypothetical protein [Pontibacter aquaedesilientis]